MESPEAGENLCPLRRRTGQDLQKNGGLPERIPSGYHRNHDDQKEAGAGDHGAFGEGKAGELCKKRIPLAYVPRSAHADQRNSGNAGNHGGKTG